MPYDEPVMRPPQEAQSLLLRATQGCTWNRCRFCYVSRGYPFKAVTPEELDREACERAPHFPSTTRIYLTGSNPFVLPAATLAAYIEVLRRHVPWFSELSMQSCVGDIARKGDGELAELQRLGLSHLYIGTESGSDEALALMHKGHTAAEAARQLARLDEAGIAYTCFYVLGLGGKGAGRKAGLAAAALFNQVHPRRISTTGMTVFPNTPLADMLREGSYEEASEREKIEELQAFLERLEADTFYDGVHYLNPLSYRFAVRDRAARQAALEDIRDALEHSTDEELELMVSRRFMHSL
ncbi:MAG: radical SAM protein [Desulfovibrio sp.]|nr:radical SAM protein [Desulfovibrio sp.]